MLSHGTKNKKSDLRTSSFCSFCVSPSFWLWRKTVSVRVSCLRSSISAAKRPLKSASNMQASSTSRERRSPDSLSEAQKAHRENNKFKGCASILAQRKQPPFTHRSCWAIVGQWEQKSDPPTCNPVKQRRVLHLGRKGRNALTQHRVSRRCVLQLLKSSDQLCSLMVAGGW